jgi:drug/metabolite transporter (DMT)-like permease
VTGIVFAIPLAAVMRKQRVRRLDLAAAAAVVLGLIVLLRALPTSHHVRLPSVGLVLPASLAVLVVVAIATVVGHFCPGRPRAILLAAGAGTAFGLTAVLVRTLIVLSGHVGTGATVVAVSICIAVVGLAGYLLLQSAYRAGHFAASLATSTVLNPIVAVLVGSLLLHEALPSDPGTLVVIGLAALLVCAGIALLVRSPAALSLAPQAETVDDAAPDHRVGPQIVRQPAGAGRIG